MLGCVCPGSCEKLASEMGKQGCIKADRKMLRIRTYIKREDFITITSIKLPSYADPLGNENEDFVYIE